MHKFRFHKQYRTVDFLPLYLYYFGIRSSLHDSVLIVLDLHSISERRNRNELIKEKTKQLSESMQILLLCQFIYMYMYLSGDGRVNHLTSDETLTEYVNEMTISI